MGVPFIKVTLKSYYLYCCIYNQTGTPEKFGVKYMIVLFKTSNSIFQLENNQNIITIFKCTYSYFDPLSLTIFLEFRETCCFILQAPCEAEAQCAALVKAGKVFATGTEDMDALTFGSSILLRHLTFSEARYHDLLTNLVFVKESMYMSLSLRLTCMCFFGQKNAHQRVPFGSNFERNGFFTGPGETNKR